MHGRLDPQFELPEDEEPYVSNPLWEILAEVPQYQLLYAKQAPRPRHINVGELRGMLRAEKLLGPRERSCREIFGLDSQVALGSIIKGRSSSQALNKELEKSLANMIGFDSYAECIYFENFRNRADAPTRGRPIPPRSPIGGLLGARVTSRSSTPGGASSAWTTILSVLWQLQDGSGTGHVTKIFDSEDDGFEAPADLSWKSSGRLGRWSPGVSGVRGVARALVRKGASWCLCFDIKDGPDQDLGLRALRARLEWLVCAGAFKGLGAGPDCSSFSVAVTPPVRNVDEPYGKKDASSRMQEKMRVGNDHALWVLSLCQLAVRCGVVFWVENPALSWLFRLPEWLEWLKSERTVGA